MPEAHPPPGTDTNTTLGMADADTPGLDWHDLALLLQAGSRLLQAMLVPPPESPSASDLLSLASLGVNVG